MQCSNLGHNFWAFLPDPEDAKLMPHTKVMLDAAKATAAEGNARPQASTGRRVVVSCPNCRAQARVSSDRETIEVKCPSCEMKWVYDPAST